MKIKDIFAKIQKGEELTEEETAAIESADEEKEVAEEEKKVNELAEKILAKIDAGQKKEVIVDSKMLTKDAVKSMTKEERQEAFFKALVKNDDSSLRVLQGQKSSYQNETADANGGYTVPDETFGEIIDATAVVSVMRPNARVINNCPAHLDITSLAGKSTAYFRSEAAKKQSSTMKFATQALTPYSLAVIVKITNELLEDSMVDIGQFIVDEMVETISQKEEYEFAAGDGTGEPTGLETYYAAYPAAQKVTNASVASLADRFVTADARLLQRYRGNAKWYMTRGQLEKVRVEKNSTTNAYMLTPDMTGATPGTILGHPVMINDNLTNIWLGDLKQAYWIGQRGGMNIARSTEATVGGDNLWEKNMTGFRVEERIDGELVNNKALIAIEAE